MPENIVQSAEPKEIARQIREFADEVESGNFIAVAFGICDKEGTGGHAAFVDQNYATPELIDEIVHTLKTAMFDSYEDEK